MSETDCNHWEVWSPPMTRYSYTAAPETGVCWTLVEARTRREAVNAAIKQTDFKDWVQEARGDGVPPQKGVQVRRFLCHHGRCLECGGICDSCQYEASEWQREEAS